MPRRLQNRIAKIQHSKEYKALRQISQTQSDRTERRYMRIIMSIRVLSWNLQLKHFAKLKQTLLELSLISCQYPHGGKSTKAVSKCRIKRELRRRSCRGWFPILVGQRANAISATATSHQSYNVYCIHFTPLWYWCLHKQNGLQYLYRKQWDITLSFALSRFMTLSLKQWSCCSQIFTVREHICSGMY